MKTRNCNFKLTRAEEDVLDWIKTQHPHLSESDLLRTIILTDAKRRGIIAGLISAAIASREEHTPRARRVPFYKLRHRE